MGEFETSGEHYNRLVEENLRKIQSEDATERLFAERELAKIARGELQNDKGKRILFDLIWFLEFALETRKCFCENIIWALGEIGREEAADILIKAMDDELADIRLKAVKALGKIGGEKAKKALEEKWNNRLKDGGEDPKIILGLRRALENMGVIAGKSSGNELMNHRESFPERRKRMHRRRKRKLLVVLNKIANAVNPFST